MALVQIVLRKVEGRSAAQVAAAARALQRSGFINYFGLQRFGNGASATHRCARFCFLSSCLQNLPSQVGHHRVGALLFRGEWREAVRCILQPRHNDRPDNVAARRLYLDEGDAIGAAKAMQPYLAAEKAILQVSAPLLKGPPSCHNRRSVLKSSTLECSTWRERGRMTAWARLEVCHAAYA